MRSGMTPLRVRMVMRHWTWFVPTLAFALLLVALAVTAIEAALILSLMLAGGKDTAALPRDSIYAAVMIICNGVVGLCVLLGGLAHHEQSFRVEGSSAGLAALIALST